MKNKYRKMRFDVGMDVELNKHLQLKLFEEGYAWFGDEREFNNYGLISILMLTVISVGEIIKKALRVIKNTSMKILVFIL